VSCACANARARVLEALGGAQDPGKDSLTRKQELASQRVRGDRGGARAEAQRREGRTGRPARGREGGGTAEG
jgi:hypothetical protein